MLEFVEALTDMLLYLLNEIAFDNIIISAPLLMVILSMLVLSFRKLVRIW